MRACVAIAEGGALEFHATRVAIGARNGRGRGEQEQEQPRQRLHNVDVLPAVQQRAGARRQSATCVTRLSTKE